MAENALFPAYQKWAYHSSFGAHEAIIPTREWSATPLVPLNALGSYTNWSGFPCDGQEMAEDLMDALKAFNPSTVIFDSVTIYTLATPTSPAIPRASKGYGVAGTNVTAGWSKAVHRVWVFRDTEWNISKLYQLDTSSNNNFDPTTTLTGNPEATAVAGAFTSLSWAWQSRGGFRPNTFSKATLDLNDKLRVQYGMG